MHKPAPTMGASNMRINNDLPGIWVKAYDVRKTVTRRVTHIDSDDIPRLQI